jgi:LacI family transcriptional regulator
LARGAEDAAVSEGYAFMVANSAHEMGRETNYLKMFQEQRLSGVLVTPVDDMVENIRQLRTTGTQVVLVDRKANASLCCSVSVDDEAGGKMAVEHLLSQGRKKIAFVGGPLDIQQVAETSIFYYGNSDKETEKKFLNIRKNEVEVVVYMQRLDEGIDLPNIFS